MMCIDLLNIFKYMIEIKTLKKKRQRKPYLDIVLLSVVKEIVARGYRRDYR
jgi:hypothetical protein